jgi:hypothetical protein
MFTFLLLETSTTRLVQVLLVLHVSARLTEMDKTLWRKHL